MSAAASVLQNRGKESIVAQILGHLDWRSLLHASETCANLNDVVASSSALQLELRRAYYAVRDVDMRPDLLPNDELRRLVEVQRRWATVDPLRVDPLDLGAKVNLFRLMHGLLVVAWDEEGGEGAAGGDGSGGGSSGGEEEGSDDDTDVDDGDSDDSMADGAEFVEPMSTTIRVYDLSTLRDLPPEAPLETLRNWTFRPGFSFKTLQISPADNVLVLSSFDTETVDDGVMVEKSYGFYVLDPARAGLDLDDLGTDLFPHPQALHPVLKFNDLFDAPDPDDYDVESARQWADCDFNLTVEGTIVILGPQASSKMSVWDWRTGERVMDAEEDEEGRDVVDAWVPAYGRDMLAVGVSRYGGDDKDVDSADGVHVRWLVPGLEGDADTVACGQESLDLIGMPVELASEVRPAAIKWHLRFPMEAGSQWTTQLDTDADVAHRAGHPLLFIAAASETYGYAAMIRIDRLLGRLAQGARKPLALADWVDLADWSAWHDQGDVLASVYGLSAVLIQAPKEEDGENADDGRRRYTLRVANYGIGSPNHPTVLGSRHPDDQTPVEVVASETAWPITFGELQDTSRPPGDVFETGMLLDYEQMAAQKTRKTKNVKFSATRPWGYAAASREVSWPEEMGELYRVDMDAEHAVLAVGDGLVILSF
ncbi:hypothetical protein Q8F55_002628 [Vanrija albida]|uniref:F-box domain-containing protein n=1 Tax=Vanrija albida TaxID=181172 RepID=A0ABR3QBC8_9TREE